LHELRDRLFKRVGYLKFLFLLSSSGPRASLRPAATLSLSFFLRSTLLVPSGQVLLVAFFFFFFFSVRAPAGVLVPTLGVFFSFSSPAFFFSCEVRRAASFLSFFFFLSAASRGGTAFRWSRRAISAFFFSRQGGRR